MREIPGRTVHHVSGYYRGDGKTDAKDAFVIADQARMRRDLQPLLETSEIAVDRYQTPVALRRIGRARLATWLKNHGVRVVHPAKNAADAAVTAAEAQSTAVPGEKTAAKMVHTLATEVMSLDQEMVEIEALIGAGFASIPTLR